MIGVVADLGYKAPEIILRLDPINEKTRIAAEVVVNVVQVHEERLAKEARVPDEFHPGAERPPRLDGPRLLKLGRDRRLVAAVQDRIAVGHTQVITAK
jgi:hypothetical protein